MIRSDKKGLKRIDAEEVVGSIPSAPIRFIKGLWRCVSWLCHQLCQ